MARRSCIVLCAVASLLTIAASAPVCAGWSAAHLLNDASEPSVKGAEICASRYGGFHAVYSCASPWQVVYRRYSSGTLSPKLVVRSGFVPNVNLCEAGNGDIHLVWEDWDGALEVGWARSSNGGQSFVWQEISNTGDTKFPLLAHYGAADSGTVIMSYWEAQYKELMWRSFDGVNWGPLTNMNQNCDNEYEVFGMCRSLQDGTIYRSYGTKINGVLSVCYRHFNGLNWEPQVVVASPGFFCRHDIAVNTTGHICLMWEQDERVWTRIFTPGVGWGPITMLVDSPSGFGSMTAVPGTTDFYIVYRIGEQIYGSRWQGGAWQAPELVSVGLSPAMVVDADVTAGPDGTLYASWEHWGTDNPQQYYSVREGNPLPDGAISGFVRDQYGVGVPGASVGSGPYVTVTLASGSFSLGVPSGTRDFSASKLGYTGQTLTGISIPPAGSAVQDFTITATPPFAPAGFAAMPSDGLVRLSWTNPEQAWFAATVVRCKTTGFPTGPADGTLVCERAASPGGVDGYTHTGRTNGVTYYYAAFSRDSDNHFSPAAQAAAVPLKASVEFVKQLPDEWLVDIYSKVVIASFAATDGCIYIREPDGSSGVRVATTQTGFAPGDVVNVSGGMTTRVLNGYAAEREIADAAVAKVSNPQFAPGSAAVAMACRSVGGGASGRVPGVKNGIGANNVGQLVRIAGEVTYKTGSVMYVDDGSRVENLYGLFTKKTGVMVMCPGSPDLAAGDLVAVTGIVEGSVPNNASWTTNRAYLHMRSWDDLRVVRGTVTTGSIGGKVTATDGAPISGATVATTTGGYSATTASDGSYLITGVAANTYTLTASRSGYANGVKSGVVVAPSQVASADFSLVSTSGSIVGTVSAAGGAGLAGATVTTSPGGYTATSQSGGAYTIALVPAGTYTVTASLAGYTSDVRTGVAVTAGQAAAVDFSLSTSAPTDRLVNGNFEGGFYNTGWGSTCSSHTSQLPNPSTSGWGWNNEAGIPFNTWDSTSTRHGGSSALAISFCSTAASPGKMGIAWQTVNLGSASATATFTAWGYHTNGNCPTIMCWNPGVSQSNPYTANSAGRYQWITTDNWGQVNSWVSRSMLVTADSSGYVTIMVGGAAHPGTSGGATLYIDDVSVVR